MENQSQLILTENKEQPAQDLALQPTMQQVQDIQSIYSDKGNFEHAQRVAKMMCSSSLIPKDYQNNIQNTMIALEIANRIGASPLMVMQNMYIVHGKPSWSSSFIIAAINSCGRFGSLRFEISGDGDGLTCLAWAYDKQTNDRLDGVPVSIAMAKKEGWFDKAGSKWKTIPDLMLRYRAATFFGRLYAPDILMGMQSQDEIIDITPISQTITLEQLTKLYHEKSDKLSAYEQIDALRVISPEKPEPNSFQKLYNVLKSK